jgi:tetratricopeptide (TPR) repeat protein
LNEHATNCLLSFDRIIYIDAISRYQIEADLETALKSINLNSKATWRDAVTDLYYSEGWLLFFDNADAPDLHLEDYLPDSPDGAVLITTRNRNLTHYAQECDIPVGPLSEREALDVLHAVANIRPPSENSSIAIVNELGCLVLAVTQAGAYIFEKPDFDMYLRIFRRHRDKLMRNDSLKGRNYNWSTYAAFDMSFSQLPPKSRKFMSICAYLHHSLIPRALFENSIASQFRPHLSIPDYPPPEDSKIISDLEDIFGFEWEEFDFENLVDPVTQRSLLDTSTDDRRHSFYNIHPLVQTFIQDLHAGVEKNHYAFLAGQLLLAAIRPTKEAGNNGWHRQLSPHVDKFPVEVKQAHVSNSLAFDEVYDSVGNWNASRPLRQYIYFQLSNAFGLRHPKTIDAMCDLGVTLSKLGRFEEAETMLGDALVFSREILGLRQPETIAVMNYLAVIRHRRGQSEEVLALCKEVLGWRHPETIAAMNNLAATLRRRRRRQSEEFERILREVLALCREVPGSRHPNTIVAMNNLAIILRDRGQLEEVKDIKKDVLALREV